MITQLIVPLVILFDTCLLNDEILSDINIISSMLAISLGLSVVFVNTSLTKSIFGFGTAVNKILCGATSSIAVAILDNVNNFLLESRRGLNTFFGVDTKERFFLPL